MADFESQAKFLALHTDNGSKTRSYPLGLTPPPPRRESDGPTNPTPGTSNRQKKKSLEGGGGPLVPFVQASLPLQGVEAVLHHVVEARLRPGGGLDAQARRVVGAHFLEAPLQAIRDGERARESSEYQVLSAHVAACKEMFLFYCLPHHYL